MSHLRLELPSDPDEAARLYEQNPVVNRVVNEVARHVPATAESVLRREYGSTLRLPAMLVFGVEPDEDMTDEALPECAEVVETESDRDGVPAVAPQNPLDAPARFRVLDAGDETVGEGVEFTSGPVAIEWLIDEGARPETYDDLDHAEAAIGESLRFAFEDPRPNAGERGLLPDGGPDYDDEDENDGGDA